MTEKGQKDFKMLLLTGNKAGNSSLGLDSAALSALNQISMPFIKELEDENVSKKGKKRRKASKSSDSSFERNSQDVRSMSAHSEIKEEEALNSQNKQEIGNVFNKNKFEDEDFEDFETNEHKIETPSKPKKVLKRVYSYEEIYLEKGPEQFLKLLSRDNKQRFFKLTSNLRDKKRHPV